MLLQSASESTEAQGTPRANDRPLEWVEIDRRLREYARHRASLDAAEAFDLLRAEQLKLHFLHGFATMYEYLERVLGYGPHAARERMRVARTLAKLPQTTAALACGELTYSAVRELTRVATAETRRAGSPPPRARRSIRSSAWSPATCSGMHRTIRRTPTCGHASYGSSFRPRSMRCGGRRAR